MPNIRQEVLIGASAETIFSALTSGEGLSGWWAPGAKAEARLGSTAHLPFGADYFKEMNITDIEPMRRVKWACVEGFEEWVGTALSFELHPGSKRTLLQSRPEAQGQLDQSKHATGTLVLFSHDDWKGYTPMFAECSYTWGQFLKSLKLFCETGKGRPWPHQHASEL